MRHFFMSARLLFCLLLLTAGASNAWAKAGAWAETEQARVRLIAAADGLAGDEDWLRLGVEFDIAEGWNIYWRAPGSVGMPPEIQFSPQSQVAEAELRWPAPQYIFEAGSEARGYHDRVILPLDVRLANPGRAFVGSAELRYQICREVCIPQQLDLALLLGPGEGELGAEAHSLALWDSRVPQANGQQALRIEAARLEPDTLSVWAQSELPWQAPLLSLVGPEGWVFETRGEAAPSAAGRRQFSASVRQEPWAKGSLDLSDIEIVVADAGRAVTALAGSLSEPAPVLRWTGLLVALGAALLGGFILNLMPCVLPVLSIKTLGFLGQSGTASAAVRRSFLATASGILVSFWLLAGLLLLIQALGGVATWGIQFQSPLFLLVMIAILLLFALNLFGLFDLPGIPGLGERSGAGRGQAFMTGMLATALATPCTAPFLGTAVAVALAASPLVTWLIFSGLGVGMALPYLAFAVAPNLTRLLPRPGPWMLWLKRGLALLLLGTALWLVTLLSALLRPEQARLPVDADLAAIAIPFDEATIAQRVAEGQSVLVDVTARWCANCKVNEVLALARPKVIAALKEDNTLFMLADWTAPDPAIAAYLQQHGAVGIPFTAVYGPGQPDGLVLPVALTRPGQVLEALEAVR